MTIGPEKPVLTVRELVIFESGLLKLGAKRAERDLKENQR